MQWIQTAKVWSAFEWKANFIAGKGEVGEVAGGRRGRKRAEIEKLLKSLLQAVRGINLG